MKKPLAIDLFAGLGGWAEGLLAEDWDVYGFDIEQVLRCLFRRLEH